jgi:8-oxo-dGTP diphosphatase
MSFKLWLENLNIVASAVVVFNEEQEILLLRRGPTAPWMPGRWNLPGGNIDEGESAEAAAKREAKEEVNLVIHKLHDAGTYKEMKEGWAASFFCCMPHEWSGSPRLSATNGIMENDNFQWVHINDIFRYPLIPIIDKAIAKSIRIFNQL